VKKKLSTTRTHRVFAKENHRLLLTKDGVIGKLIGFFLDGGVIYKYSGYEGGNSILLTKISRGADVVAYGPSK
jgi:hypothetical protein